MSEEPLEADRAPGAPHPRETEQLIGQEAAERDFLDAFTSDRMHHGWLIRGPRGVGKATLAWRIARFLLTTPHEDGLFGAPPPPASLDPDPNHPALARLLALSEPHLFLLRRPWDADRERLRQEITVDEVRKMRDFFGLSVTDGGRRVVIVDAADEMNVNAANALLKLLEEPPADTVMLLVCHQPARILPTILSRCRTLLCRPLDPPEIAAALHQAGTDPDPEMAETLAALSGGSVGTALRLITLDGAALYSEVTGLFTGPLDRPRALKLAESATGRAAAERLDLMLDLFDLFLSRLALTGVSGPPAHQASSGEAELLSRLSPSPTAARRWASLHQSLGARARHGRAVNLDPAALILDMVLKIHETAAELAA